jgi:hypothetical protein
MTRRILPLFLAATIAATGAASGTREVEAVVTEFNSAVAANDHKRLVALFTARGTYEGWPAAEGVQQADAKRLPWDERMPLRISIRKMTFPRPDNAIVNATQSDSSPLGDTRTWTCVFVLVREGSNWKISSYVESAPVRTFP